MTENQKRQYFKTIFKLSAELLAGDVSWARYIEEVDMISRQFQEDKRDD